MKIACTPGGARVALSKDEIEKIGHPTRAALLFEEDRLLVVPDRGDNPLLRGLGGSICRRKDRGYPFAFGLPDRHPFLISAGKYFGAEVVPLRSLEGDKLCYPLPTMSLRPIKRSCAGDLKRSKTSVSAEGRPVLTLDEAVRFINDRKDQMGKNFIISVDSSGYLEVLQRSGR